MSGSNSISGIITGGIQDISALLPLLGTEQCERHVGLALERGYLYSSITPISIFGSLGIVRAAFDILIASLNIQRYRFVGSQKLSDGGFTLTGVVPHMIALDPKHPERFLAETRLQAMLLEESFDNVQDLTLPWNKEMLRWNFLLIAFTLVTCSVGLVPYIGIVHDPHMSLKAPFPIGFGFPLLRVLGSGICVTFTQFLIQIRVLDLLKARLLFINIDQAAVAAGVDLEREVRYDMRLLRNATWNSEQASEECIWALCAYLKAGPDQENMRIRPIIRNIYSSECKRLIGSIENRISSWLRCLLGFGLVLGCLSTVVGYIGRFYLIQHAASSKGPLLWLGLEALLSIFRILVWAINPSWDDSKGIVFEVQLASHAPLITCNKFEHDILRDGIAPLMRFHGKRWK
ncbi:hypothetical protein D9619_000530 [Psilocybe cf. subviscida]|uniref:Uncharacterized protein n=1 Tax=Psilocybe cf. subviscida TaxID=2480587 RepID=A0A8H5BDB3_9AGAR|nr:hypothetical protein D9619_000530 [Psilocybe cf. subviscida]